MMEIDWNLPRPIKFGWTLWKSEEQVNEIGKNKETDDPRYLCVSSVFFERGQNPE